LLIQEDLGRELKSTGKTRLINIQGCTEMADLLYLAIVFFVIALILGVLGVRGAGISMDIAKWLIIVFVILAVLSLIFGGTFHLAVLPLVI
jgi:uncharacterized membrane protein YtjA (UPF0391 family)